MLAIHKLKVSFSTFIGTDWQLLSAVWVFPTEVTDTLLADALPNSPECDFVSHNESFQVSGLSAGQAGF